VALVRLCLGYVPIPIDQTARPQLEEAVKEGDPELRAAAEEALQILNSGGPRRGPAPGGPPGGPPRGGPPQAGDTRPNDTKPSDTRPGDTRPGDTAKTKPKETGKGKGD
jgi:hypothetical protein